MNQASWIRVHKLAGYRRFKWRTSVSSVPQNMLLPQGEPSVQMLHKAVALHVHQSVYVDLLCRSFAFLILAVETAGVFYLSCYSPLYVVWRLTLSLQLSDTPPEDWILLRSAVLSWLSHRGRELSIITAGMVCGACGCAAWKHACG